MRRTRPTHRITEAEQRWTFEERQRIERALRVFASPFKSYRACAEALGVRESAVKRVLSDGRTITVDLADRLAAALGTTADEIARGTWKREGAAA